MINQNKMTAVEFIRKEFLEKLTNENYKKSFDEIINQAKEMEKEQIVKAYEVGISRGTNYDEDVYHKNNWRSGEKYYNETFKSE